MADGNECNCFGSCKRGDCRFNWWTGSKSPITRTGIKIVNQQFGMGTVKSFITQPTQRVISKNFAMGVVKTAIIAPIIAAISSNVIKKFSEVSAVNLTDAKKAKRY